jgi:hypothetical protein
MLSIIARNGSGRCSIVSISHRRDLKNNGVTILVITLGQRLAAYPTVATPPSKYDF